MLRFLPVGQPTLFRAVAQGFSVHVWGTWGRRFKSAQPDFEGAVSYSAPFFFVVSAKMYYNLLIIKGKLLLFSNLEA